MIYQYFNQHINKYIHTLTNMENHSTEIDRALETAKKYWAETDWDLLYDQDGIVSEKKLFDACPVYCHRISATIDRSSEQIVEEFWNMDMEKCKKFDKSIVLYQERERGDDWHLLAIRSAFSWPIQPRETLGLQVKKYEGDTIWLVSVSVENEKYPCDNDVVRTKLHFDVASLEKLDDNKTKYTKMTMIDPMGSIPPQIINWFFGNRIHVVEVLRGKSNDSNDSI